MKISKVDHTRTAVTASNIDHKGILYDNPAKDSDPVVDIGKKYDDLSKRAEGLYSIFNPAKSKEDKSVESFRKKVNRLFKELLKKVVEPDSEAAVRRQIIILRSDKMSEYIPDKDILENDQIEELVNGSLRKALRINEMVNGERYYLPDILISYLKKLNQCEKDADKHIFSQQVDSVGEDGIKAFLRTVNRDFWEHFRNPQKRKNTIRSIENQSVKVKVIEQDGKNLLIPSNADHPKKKYSFEFMKAYAAGTVQEKSELVVNMRRLLVLYLSGRENIDDITVNEKSFCNELTEDDVLDPELSDFLNEMQSMNLKWRDVKDEISNLQAKRKLSKEESSKKNALKDEKRQLEEETKKLKASIAAKIDETLVAHFRAAVAAQEKKPSDFYWIDFFDREARKILLKGYKLDTYKIGLLWLGKRIWGNWTAYIAQKFIDYGKAVYHFSIPDVSGMDPMGMAFGGVLPAYQTGISSFEYERVKARENLDRSTASAITFAVNTFSRAILEKMPVKYNERTGDEEIQNDILFTNPETYKPALYQNAGQRLLRYFGGFSTWKDNEDIALYAEEDNGIELIEPIRLLLSDLRNQSFHYTGAVSSTDTSLIRTMYDQETGSFSDIIRQKYYSNNVHWFYNTEDIKALLECLYEKPAYVPPQVPSFNRLFNRNSAYTHDKILMGKARQKISGKGTDEAEVFKGTFLFLLKEIYYNAFLQDPRCRDFFMTLIREGDKRITVENTEALRDFRTRIEVMGENVSLGEICQQIMTDYELQNQDKRVHKSGENKKEIYKHFRTLLYLYMRESFVDYLLKSEQAELFRFIRTPFPNESARQIGKEEFLTGWQCTAYNKFLKNEDKDLLKWYILAHFLAPKHLNHLVGAFKSYEVYIKDIDRRAGDTRNRISPQITLAESKRVRNIIEMLSFSMNFCARTTNRIDDYFSDEEEYAAVLSGFLDIQKKYISENSTGLRIFCDETVPVTTTLPNGKKKSEKVRVGIYHDGYNTIPNRNIFLASMYGDMNLLTCTCDKVSTHDIAIYYKKKNELAAVFKTGVCKTKEDHITMREFQNMKNRIEFNDLLSFTEMVSDLNGQLVSWSYFRERDFMYMQLGIQYTKLFFTKTVPAEDFRRQIIGKDFAIKDGAILYQIVAMYTYGLPVYGFDQKGFGKVAVPAGVVSSGAIGGFVRSYCHENFSNPATYNEGLYFFENIDEHDSIIETRNYIDHFKYYAGHERSILDLYSEVYERFFAYSVNYKKSVSYIITNILERYFVILRTRMARGERITKKGRKTVSAISVSGASSANMTYKIKAGEQIDKITVPARTDQYLKTVLRILEYKSER